MYILIGIFQIIFLEYVELRSVLPPSLLVSVSSFSLCACDIFDGREEWTAELELGFLDFKSVKPTCFETTSSLRKLLNFCDSGWIILSEFGRDRVAGKGTQSLPDGI